MTTAEVDLQELASRVRALEKQNRRWKFSSLLALLLLAFSLTIGLRAQGQGDFQPHLLRAKNVEAQGFVLKDIAGNVRAALRMNGDQPVLELYDASGRVVWSTPVKSGPIPLG
jgi:hypothetical protein